MIIATTSTDANQCIITMTDNAFLLLVPTLCAALPLIGNADHDVWRFWQIQHWCSAFVWDGSNASNRPPPCDLLLVLITYCITTAATHGDVDAGATEDTAGCATARKALAMAEHASHEMKLCHAFIMLCNVYIMCCCRVFITSLSCGFLWVLSCVYHVVVVVDHAYLPCVYHVFLLCMYHVFCCAFIICVCRVYILCFVGCWSSVIDVCLSCVYHVSLSRLRTCAT